VPVLGLALIGIGAVILVAMYLIPGLPGGNYNLIVGFIAMAAGLVTLSRWR
jgi:hypothetical protein